MARDGSVTAGMIWMALIGLLLFWLPVLGPLLAGMVGGKKAGGVGNALVAVFLPGVLLGAMLFVFSTAMVGLPGVGLLMATMGALYYVANIGMLLVGAIVGGLMA